MPIYDVEADINIGKQEGILAYGMVTVNHCIKFPVQMRSYVKEETEEKVAFISFPRRQSSSGSWEDVVHPNKELRIAIEKAVGEAIKKELVKDLNLPEIEKVQITPLKTDQYKDRKVRICGLAMIEISGLSIRGITIRESEHGLFVNMPQFNKDQVYKDVVYATSKAMQEKIREAVLEGYLELTRNNKSEEKETSISDVSFIERHNNSFSDLPPLEDPLSDSEWENVVNRILGEEGIPNSEKLNKISGYEKLRMEYEQSKTKTADRIKEAVLSPRL